MKAPIVSRAARLASAFLLCATGANANAQTSSPVDADRKAILAMQGEYTVDFAFDETVLIKPGYERASAQRTWRPLPRREYTRRSDYNALDVVNRHTIVRGGWTHEQFNTKVLRGADGSRSEIAREFGFNDYRKAEGIDFKPAYDYWSATKDYWMKVRVRWKQRLAQAPGVRLNTKIDGMGMIMPLFTQADEVQSGKPVADADIDKVFAEWVEAAPR